MLSLLTLVVLLPAAGCASWPDREVSSTRSDKPNDFSITKAVLSDISDASGKGWNFHSPATSP